MSMPSDNESETRERSYSYSYSMPSPDHDRSLTRDASFSPPNGAGHNQSLATVKNQSMNSVRGITRGFSERLDELKNRNKGLEDNITDLERDRNSLQVALAEAKAKARSLEDENHQHLETIDGLRAKLSFTSRQASSRSHSIMKPDLMTSSKETQTPAALAEELALREAETRHFSELGAFALCLEEAEARAQHAGTMLWGLGFGVDGEEGLAAMALSDLRNAIADTVRLQRLSEAMQYDHEARVDELLKDSNSSKQTQSELEDRVRSLENELVQQRQAAIAEATKTTCELTSDREVLHDTIDLLSSQIETLQDQIVHLKEEIKERDDALNGVEGVVQEMQQEARSAVQRSEEALHTEQRRCAGLNETVSGLRDELKASEERFEEEKKETARQLKLAAQRDGAAREEELRREMEEIEKQHTESKRRLIAEQKRVAELEEQAAVRGAELGERLALLDKKLKDTETERARLSEDLAHANDALEDERRATQKLQSELKQTKSEVSVAEEELALVAGLARRKEAEIEGLRRKMSTLEESLSMTADALDAVTEKEKRATREVLALKSERDTLQSTLEQERGEVQQSVERRREQVDSERALRLEMSEMRGRIEELELESSRLEAKTKKTTADLRVCEDSRRELEVALEEAAAERAKLSREISSNRLSTASAEAERVELTTALSRAEEKATKAQAALSKATAECVELRAALATAERELETQIAKLLVVQSQNKALREDVERLESEKASVESELLSKEGAIKLATHQLRVAEDQRVALERQHDSLTDQLAKAVTDKMSMGGAVASLEEENGELMATLDDAERQLKRCEKELAASEERAGRLAEEASLLKEELASVSETRKGSEAKAHELEYRVIALQHSLGAKDEGSRQALRALEELESVSRFAIAEVFSGSFFTIVGELSSYRRRAMRSSRELMQKRAELEHMAAERDEERDGYESTIATMREELNEGRETSHTLGLEVKGHQCATEYWEGRAMLTEKAYEEVFKLLTVLPRAQSAHETRARTVLGLIHAHAGGPNATHANDEQDELAYSHDSTRKNGPTMANLRRATESYLAQLRTLSKAHRAAVKELALYKHMYHSEKAMEGRMLMRSVSRLGMVAGASYSAGTSTLPRVRVSGQDEEARSEMSSASASTAVALALATLEGSEEATRASIVSAYWECLTALQVSLIPLLEPLNFV